MFGEQTFAQLRTGLRLLKQKSLGSIPLFALPLHKLWSVDTLFVTLSLTINKTLKWLPSLPDTELTFSNRNRQPYRQLTHSDRGGKRRKKPYIQQQQKPPTIQTAYP